jgi:hypothetical protein
VTLKFITALDLDLISNEVMSDLMTNEVSCEDQARVKRVTHYCS